MKAAGCSDPRSWVNSELGENLPQFARFLMLRDVHALADDVDSTLSEALFDRPELEQTLATLRGAVDPQALHALLHAYGKTLGNSFVMAVDEGPAMREDSMPGWLLMETNANDEATGRLVQGLHEDYLDFTP
ncbi:hypothetical protein [Stenotrophomonas lactitubi]|uniref:hypothetical protein n=1 Tax=Stenotrophomonas lactitubi TaxID=2045214 RepID=UPI001D70C8B4|nr:hypothetical protein [Stenotrophomonas lactitubi]CAH0234257.1 hypothetical protein SRABI35_02539 [Stenotrophomonas lactitubi]